MATETLWLILLGCAAATFVWRGTGVLLVRRIDADGGITLICRATRQPGCHRT